mmetsp:Transcript_37876/g.75492  ORF Transcript_37876/g.75492 Transcript_37876/m.75492 type:complete len:201 (+) Transcript_37876:52-654(+)
MVFHILDISLVQEWLGTCNEYVACVRKPFSRMSFKQMWSCSQSDLQAWFQTWSVVQFWWSVIINIAACVILVVLADNVVGAAVSNCIAGIITAYLWAHLGWFAVVKKDGCCCCCIVCMSQAPILLLIFGLWLILWGVVVICNSLAYLDKFDLGFLYVICYASYAVPLLYMGAAMLKMWQGKSSERQLGDTHATVVGNQNA